MVAQLTEEGGKIRVLVVDDREALRAEVRAVIESIGACDVVGEAADGVQAVELAEKLCPNVVIMDVAMPVMNGIEATRDICERGLDTKVIALSMHSDALYVREMLDAGANAYLLKDSAAENLAPAIEAVLRGECYLGSGVSK